MLIFLLMFLFSPQIAPKEPNPPTLVVHVVDPVSAPMAGVKVTVKSLVAKGKPTTVNADKDENAKFWVEADRDYSIEAKWPGLKTKRLARIHVSKPGETSPTQYLELQMELSGRMTTVY